MHLSFRGDFLDRVAVRFRRGGLPDDCRAVFDSDAGRRVLAHFCRWAGVMQTHEGWSNDQIQYATGRRDAALYLLGILRMEAKDLQQISHLEPLDE
jgi:hypothetical protein